MASSSSNQYSKQGFEQQQEKSLLLSLPQELLYEVFKNLDLKDLDYIRGTCKQLDSAVERYKIICKEIYKKQENDDRKSKKGVLVPAGLVYDDDDDDDNIDFLYPSSDEYGDEYDGDDLEYIQNEMLDNLSFGSNYDSELDEAFNGDDEGGDIVN